MKDLVSTRGLGLGFTTCDCRSSNKAEVSRSLDEIIARVVNEAGEGDAVVIMSNGGFGGLPKADYGFVL